MIKARATFDFDVKGVAEAVRQGATPRLAKAGEKVRVDAIKSIKYVPDVPIVTGKGGNYNLHDGDPRWRRVKLKKGRFKVTKGVGKMMGWWAQSGKKIWYWRQSSQPGTPPHTHVREGKRGYKGIRDWIVTAVDTKKRKGATVVVGVSRSAGAMIGKRHEFGRGKSAKRAFMRPALLRVLWKIPTMFHNLALAHTPAGRRLNARRGRRIHGRVR